MEEKLRRGRENWTSRANKKKKKRAKIPPPTEIYFPSGLQWSSQKLEGGSMTKL
jgi:hypothetical protein